MSHPSRNHLGAALWGVLLGLGIAIAIAACASQSRSATVAGMDARKQRIQELWNEIGDWREEKGMARDPLIDLTRRPEIIQNSVSKIRQCPPDDDPPAKTEVCDDVCDLKKNICDNAESICRIAGQLGDDDWARDKCKSAKASCKEATEKCCGCLADEKPSLAPTETPTPAGAETGGAVH